MRTTKFFRIGIILTACILTLFLAVEAGFTPVVRAKKPPGKGKQEYRTEYGYATLRDGDTDVVKSDSWGQYIDKHNEGGEDQVEVQTYSDTGALYQCITFMGEVENQSTRKANFLFDFLNDATEITVPEENRAVYDILVWTDGTKDSRRGNQVGDKYYLNDDTVHFRVAIAETKEQGVFKGQVVFVVDPGWDGTDPDAITQTTVNNFYDNDKDVNYGTNELGHIIYYLDYDNGFMIEGEYPTWTFTPNPGPVRLTTTKYKNKGGKGARFVVSLATYDYLPFQLTVSLNSLDGSAAPQLDPRKHNTFSTLWGRIKAR